MTININSTNAARTFAGFILDQMDLAVTRTFTCADIAEKVCAAAAHSIELINGRIELLLNSVSAVDIETDEFAALVEDRISEMQETRAIKAKVRYRVR
jgi:hypothetical protein